ncbi:Rpn family recombination-promoting nuclease/putative transposase [Hyalangium gracile]|uniref:Rpn family recombination-promoting nuclease/putative transposase n=1 Tax=Hyalangium gracile TaxID=394092 RepID=UPI001CCF549E|nr:Rpn family recombination-promoting nuclease/putative transposase [Hyalangium gracile]
MSGPHDLFVRHTFDSPERAAAELRAVLPPEVVSQVDWSSLRRESGSVVDAELRERQSDLLFSARMHGGQPLLLYLLLEHQSSVDKWMAFRMLRYVVRQLERWLQQNPDSEKLPVVLPVVMYHGPEGRWTAARRMEELFHLPDEALELWRELVPRFEYRLDDLTTEREEALRARTATPQVVLTWLLLRSGRSEDLAARLEDWRSVLAEVLLSPEGPEAMRAAVHYVHKVGSEGALAALWRVLDSIARERRAEDVMGPYNVEFLDEAHAKGVVEGQAQALSKGVLRILAARGISVDESTRQRILACTDPVLLDEWQEKALKATSLADLEGLERNG